MRGVLTDADLFVYAIASLIAKPMVVVIDDGHAMPYAQAFEWPDGSPGLCVRLSEDGDGLPTLVELTHAASGRRTTVDLPFSTYLSTTAAANRVFPDISTMLADTSQWSTADCLNGVGSDGVFSSWKKVPETSFTENTTDLRLMGNGKMVMRTFVREPQS